MKCSNNSGVMFLAVGVVFLSLGIKQSAFLGVGVAFLALGIGMMKRKKDCQRLK